MSKFLVSFYPIEPYRSLLCCEINNQLDYGMDAQNLLDEYYRGLERKGLKDGDLLYFNNSSWIMVEAESMFTAIDKFKEQLKNDHTRNV